MEKENLLFMKVVAVILKSLWGFLCDMKGAINFPQKINIKKYKSII